GSVFHHPYFICHRKGQSAAASAFSDDYGQYRHFQSGHFHQVSGNRLTLSVFFRFQSAERSRRIHKVDNGTAEFFRLFHKAQSLSVSLRRRHTEIALDIFLCSTTFLLADHSYRTSVQVRDPAYSSAVVPIMTVPVKFFKVGKN